MYKHSASPRVYKSDINLLCGLFILHILYIFILYFIYNVANCNKDIDIDDVSNRFQKKLIAQNTNI